MAEPQSPDDKPVQKQRRKKGRAVSGWVNLDKPLGLGSTPAVGQIRRLFEAQKAGHAGTLDPLASGILPIALGEATKTVSFMQEADKTYEVVVDFSAATETDDAEGDVFICSCCEAGEGYEDASGNALPLCMETQLDPPGLI